jgi:phage gpG-like protein
MATNEDYAKLVDEYAKDLEVLAGQEVVVGIPKAKNGQHQGEEVITLAELGAMHEYGAPKAGIPQRSFLRAPLSANTNKLLKTIEKDLKFSKTKPNVALGRLGAAGQSVVLEAFNTQNNGTWNKLKPATIRARRKGTGEGQDKPLIDTGQLRRSITFEVRDVTQ